MGGIRTELEEACDEHDRLEHSRIAVHARREELLVRFLDALAPRLLAAAAELPFGFEGTRARGLVLPREGPAPPLYLIVGDAAWTLIERHAHGVHAVVNRVPVAALLDAFGRDTIAVLESAEAAAHAAASRAASKSVTPAPPPVRVVVPAARGIAATPARARTRACTECDAQPNEANYARHLREVHGLDPRAPAAKRAPRPSHQVCKLCGARLPAGRLDPHLTAAHGIFHVHPRGDAREARRAAIQAARSTPSLPSRASGRAEPSARAPEAGRDFLAEARRERTLVVRADSPLRNREPNGGRFSDAPDVERMDGDSDA